MIPDNVDTLKNDIVNDFGSKTLDILLTDHAITAAKNDGKTHHIIWATNDYESMGEGYGFFDEIEAENITGEHSDVIMPRVLKQKALQKSRVKKKAEIFTPAWVCNRMNNDVDERWFGHRDVFNLESEDKRQWEPIDKKVEMPEGKTWQDYIAIREMEITCGEAPFVVSRYDASNGTPIPLRRRIGFLDRRMRIVNENAHGKEEWIDSARVAYENILAYEWQGDSLLLARENVLYTFVDNYKMMFDSMPDRALIEKIADIISWNVWQMDGLKFVIPCTCHDVVTTNLLGEKEVHPCPGCKTRNPHKHNGIPALIK